ncbi:hypothetical protein HMPREF1580_00527 [Gardnerella vaginalis JCP8070]|nr:hypothetical protein HMPREF1586_00572 [Gardnerella vaginalis JCP8522]EPI60222.1 hypothetical protein HMPREF1580_00527 [Gardnerella vaginalis JCP8070]EPI61081.1 hypothetical protein HMPREF1579_00247 [Gardnerella vaginalis JCP8066]
MQRNSHCARINYCAFLRFNRVFGSISTEYLDEPLRSRCK